MSKIKKIKQPKELGLDDLYFMILRGKNTVILITLICTLLSLAGFFSSKQVYTVEKDVFAVIDNVKNPFLSSLNNQDRFETVTLDINLYTKKAMFLNFKNSLIVNNYSEELINKISNVINFEGNKEEKYKLYLNIISNLRLDDKNQEKIKFYLEWHNLIDGNKILNEIIDYKKLNTEKYFQNLSKEKMEQALKVLKTKIEYYEKHEKNKFQIAIADLKMNILTAKKSDIKNYNLEIKVPLPSYFQGYKALEEMLKHNENLLKKGLENLKILQEDLEHIGAEDLHQLMRAWELKHRTLTSQCVAEHTLFREETRWPGYYYRGDHLKLDDDNWHCLTVSRRDPKTKKFTLEKVPVYHIVDEKKEKKAS